MIDTFHVAGTFGSFIDPRSAITIGMLPDLPMDRFRDFGRGVLWAAPPWLFRPDAIGWRQIGSETASPTWNST